MTTLPVFAGLCAGFMAKAALIYNIRNNTTSIKWWSLVIKIVKQEILREALDWFIGAICISRARVRRTADL